MKLIMGSLIAFILFLAFMAWVVTDMYLTGKVAQVSSIGELAYDLVLLLGAKVLAILALGKFLRLKRKSG